HAPADSLPYKKRWQAMCPELSSSEEDSCVVSCSTDDDCPQGIRCCPRSPCSRSCVFPVMGNSHPSPLQKAGRCPRVPVPLAPEPCSESTECSVDSQCAGSRKCCFSMCAMRCLDPATGDYQPWGPTNPKLPVRGSHKPQATSPGGGSHESQTTSPGGPTNPKLPVLGSHEPHSSHKL
uniref:WAP domain-containing protein n=1 Tax=Lynx canadensis TaxID=61383 RepID=A0A667FY09_LYNCA